jgi:hypothetical protein
MHPCIHTCIHPYIHACMHNAYIRPCTHTSIHTYIHPYMHTFTHTYIHTYIHTYMHAYIHTCIHTHIHSPLVLPTVSRVIMNWNATGTTNLKNTIHSALSSFHLHCSLTSDGQRRIGTKGNNEISIWYTEMQLQLCPVVTGGQQCNKDANFCYSCYKI